MTDPDDTPDPPPPSGSARPCRGVLESGRFCGAECTGGRDVGLCRDCIARLRAEVVAAMAKRGACLHDRALGWCRECGGDSQTRRAAPPPDRARRRAIGAAHYARLRAAGRCTTCGHPAWDGRSRCEPCAVARMARRRGNRETISPA